MSRIDWSQLVTAAAKAAAAAAETRAAALTEARAYLAATDWMVIRAAETGRPVPDAVTARRRAAREALGSDQVK